jgi:hypothetical protein
MRIQPDKPASRCGTEASAGPDGPPVVWEPVRETEPVQVREQGQGHPSASAAESAPGSS